MVARARCETDAAARALGLSGRQYLTSACGAATVLLAMNQLGCGRGSCRVPPESTRDQDAAKSAVAGDEFIFDVQTHQVSADRPWWDVKRPSLADFRRPSRRRSAERRIGQDASRTTYEWSRVSEHMQDLRPQRRPSVRRRRAAASKAARCGRSIEGAARIRAFGRRGLSNARPAHSPRNDRVAEVGARALTLVREASARVTH